MRPLANNPAPIISQSGRLKKSSFVQALLRFTLLQKTEGKRTAFATPKSLLPFLFDMLGEQFTLLGSFFSVRAELIGDPGLFATTLGSR